MAITSPRTARLDLRRPLSHEARALAQGWGLLGLSVAAYAAISVLVFHQPLHVGGRRLRFFDLRVFRDGAGAVIHGQPLYGASAYRGLALHFTYPPFAALALLPTRLASLAVDGIVSCGVNLALLIGLLRVTPRLWHRDTAGSPVSLPWAVAAALAAVLLWSEPVSVTVGYGQVDLLIALLCAWDLGRPDGARGRGVGIGVAAALKLTPLIFIPYLLLTGRRRSAVTATATFLAGAAAGFAVLPADSIRYWGGLMLNTSRVGNLADTANQAVLGSVARLAHADQTGALGMCAIGAVALLGLAVAVRAGRRGDHGVAFAVCAITSLLVSPVSWTHHWVLAIPAAAAVFVWARERRARWVLGSIVALGVAAFTYLPELLMGVDLHLPGVLQVVGAPYVILGLLVVVCVGAEGERRRTPGGPSVRRA